MRVPGGALIQPNAWGPCMRENTVAPLWQDSARKATLVTVFRVKLISFFDD